MTPEINIFIRPDENSDYAIVTVGLTMTTADGAQYYWRPYDQLRLAQGLTETMAIEPWLLATLAEHTDAIKAALAAMINQGSKTLMLDTHELKKK